MRQSKNKLESKRLVILNESAIILPAGIKTTTDKQGMIMAIIIPFKYPSDFIKDFILMNLELCIIYGKIPVIQLFNGMICSQVNLNGDKAYKIVSDSPLVSISALI
jgi:hypothetical protein